MGIMRYVGRTFRAYTLFKDQRLSAIGLSGHQSLYLRSIIQHPGITQDELAEGLIFNKSSVSRQVAALERAGFIRQERSDSDKRNLLIFPTEKGISLLPAILDTSREFYGIITADLTEEEKKLLKNLCQRICDRAREALDEK